MSSMGCRAFCCETIDLMDGNGIWQWMFKWIIYQLTDWCGNHTQLNMIIFTSHYHVLTYEYFPVTTRVCLKLRSSVHGRFIGRPSYRAPGYRRAEWSCAGHETWIRLQRKKYASASLTKHQNRSDPNTKKNKTKLYSTPKQPFYLLAVLHLTRPLLGLVLAEAFLGMDLNQDASTVLEVQQRVVEAKELHHREFFFEDMSWVHTTCWNKQHQKTAIFVWTKWKSITEYTWIDKLLSYFSGFDSYCC